MFVDIKLFSQPNAKWGRYKSQYWSSVAGLMAYADSVLEVTLKLLSMRQKWDMQQFYSIEYMG